MSILVSQAQVVADLNLLVVSGTLKMVLQVEQVTLLSTQDLMHTL
jgi:hypothetical protein